MLEFIVNIIVAQFILRFVSIGRVSYARRVYGALVADILTLGGAAFWAFDSTQDPVCQGFVIVGFIFGLVGAIGAALNESNDTPLETMTDQFARLSREVERLRGSISNARNDETMTRAERLARIDLQTRRAEDAVGKIGAQISHAMKEARTNAD